jgi:hypothetical protein
MAKAFADKGVTFLFVYTREAHPGENYPAHRSMERKIAHARAFRAQQRIERPILVDDLSGTGHLRYGDLPNMTYLIGRGGRVLFRSDWTDPPTIELMLNYMLNVRERRRAGERVTGFYAEFAGFRVNDRAKFMETLKVAGPQAVDDFARMVKIWAQQPTETGNLEV